MTALKEFDRLESTGIWREAPEAQRRDVVVSFGEASLIIKDKTDTALTHWSLPAIHRLNPGKRPALFSPAADAQEELEIDDPLMIDAIEKIRKTILKRRPHQGRLRLAVSGGIVAALLAIGVFWLPDALVRHTVSVVPDSTRLSIGTSLLGHMTRLTGDTCKSPLGTEALARLKTRVLSTEMRKAYVMPDLGSRDTVTLPGRLLLLDHTLIEDHDTPEVAAGYMLHATRHRDIQDPVEDLLEHAGTTATFRMLTTGRMEDTALRNYASALLAAEEPAVDAEGLLPKFEAARVAASPFAYALDVTGENSLSLIEADPYRGTEAPSLLSDGDWISLQEICAS